MPTNFEKLLEKTEREFDKKCDKTSSENGFRVIDLPHEEIKKFLRQAMLKAREAGIQEWKKYCLPKKRKWLKKGTMVFGGISTKEIQIMNSSDDGFNDCRNHIKQRDKKFMSKKEGK